jgi:hypothetical protein
VPLKPMVLEEMLGLERMVELFDLSTQLLMVLFVKTEPMHVLL